MDAFLVLVGGPVPQPPEPLLLPLQEPPPADSGDSGSLWLLGLAVFAAAVLPAFVLNKFLSALREPSFVR